MTALLAAALRARETARPHPRVIDVDAARLAGPEGFEVLEGLQREVPEAAGFEMMISRTQYFDGELRRLLAGEKDEAVQVVKLGAGMDTRERRLGLPHRIVFFEVDDPRVLTLKQRRLAGAAGSSGTSGVGDGHCVAVALDLARESLSIKLPGAGFDPYTPTIWIAEGLLLYLEERVVHRILDDVSSLSPPGSWCMADLVPAAALSSPASAHLRAVFEKWGAPLLFGTADPAALFAMHGWEVEVVELLSLVLGEGQSESEEGQMIRGGYVVTARRSTSPYVPRTAAPAADSATSSRAGTSP